MKKQLRVQIFLNKKKEFCFRVLGGNNRIIVQSESYKTKQSALKTIKLLMGTNDWIIKDV